MPHNYAKQIDGSVMCSWCGASPADGKPACQDSGAAPATPPPYSPPGSPQSKGPGACMRANCPCTSREGKFDFCCRSCGRGTPCAKNYHPGNQSPAQYQVQSPSQYQAQSSPSQYQAQASPAQAQSPTRPQAQVGQPVQSAAKGPGSCTRPNCPCTTRSPGFDFCCRSCGQGTPCQTNIHAGQPSSPSQAYAAGQKGPGSCTRPNCPCTSRSPGFDFCCRSCAQGTPCQTNNHAGQPSSPSQAYATGQKGPGACMRKDCPCTGKRDAKYDYCCLTCSKGQACRKNYHSVTQPIPQPGQVSVKGPGSCKRSNCPCTGRTPGYDFCCKTCSGGVACAKNYHVAAPSVPAQKGPGSCSRPNCPCTGKSEAKYDFCCQTCAKGSPCPQNFHHSVAPGPAPTIRPGGKCARSGCPCTGKKDPSQSHCCKTCAQGKPCLMDYHGRIWQKSGRVGRGGARTMVMYHGTSWDNAQNIQKVGFKPSSGGCLGPGVYVAEIDKATKFAHSYSRRYGGSGEPGLVKVVVSYQNAKLVDGDDDLWQSQGFDACYASKTSASPNPEWCLLSAKQVQVIQIKKL